jgi:hypothetical protein
MIGGLLFHPNHDETRPARAGLKDAEEGKAETP